MCDRLNIDFYFNRLYKSYKITHSSEEKKYVSINNHNILIYDNSCSFEELTVSFEEFKDLILNNLDNLISPLIYIKTTNQVGKIVEERPSGYRIHQIGIVPYNEVRKLSLVEYLEYLCR